MTRNRSRSIGVAGVLKAMRRGTVLHFENVVGRPQWRMSDGQIVRDWVARLVVTNRHVVGVDALFADATPQTFRYVDYRDERERIVSASFARRANRRLDSLIKHLIKTDGDCCTLCRAPFTDNARTFYGIAFGTVAITGVCCEAKLDPEIGVGVYVAAKAVRS